jgi:FixJ family two-component response regulator
MAHVVAGELNKQVAYALGIGEHTVKVHRSRVMEKMGVQSLADLVRAAERLSLEKS